MRYDQRREDEPGICVRAETKYSASSCLSGFITNLNMHAI